MAFGVNDMAAGYGRRLVNVGIQGGRGNTAFVEKDEKGEEAAGP